MESQSHDWGTMQSFANDWAPSFAFITFKLRLACRSPECNRGAQAGWHAKEHVDYIIRVSISSTVADVHALLLFVI